MRHVQLSSVRSNTGPLFRVRHRLRQTIPALSAVNSGAIAAVVTYNIITGSAE